MAKENTAFGTREWASHNINISNGCYNNCKYCYSKSMAIRFKRKTSENWTEEVLVDTNDRKFSKKYNGRIMFPSSHDITPNTLEASIRVLRGLLKAGNDLLIVTKPNLDCVKSLCNELAEYKDKILFRFTIGSVNNQTLKYWEPNAPSFEERLESLKFAYNEGFKTSISCEPFLDKTVEELVKITRQYVTDSIWIGKANKLKGMLSLNGYRDENSVKIADELEEIYKSDYKKHLYNLYKDDKKIKWKDSLKKDFGIALQIESGLDL